MTDSFTVPIRFVIRRVGGLEASAGEGRAETSVIRRVGGLEVSESPLCCGIEVIRRVGGLEVPLFHRV